MIGRRNYVCSTLKTFLGMFSLTLYTLAHGSYVKYLAIGLIMAIGPSVERKRERTMQRERQSKSTAQRCWLSGHSYSLDALHFIMVTRSTIKNICPAAENKPDKQILDNPAQYIVQYQCVGFNQPIITVVRKLEAYQQHAPHSRHALLWLQLYRCTRLQ